MRRTFGVLMVVALTAALLGYELVTPEPVEAGARGCVDEVVLEVEGPGSTVFGRVSIPPGHWLQADIERSIEQRIGYSDFGGRLSLHEDVRGFPGEPFGSSSYSTGSWGSSLSKTSRIYVKNTGEETDVILELDAWVARVDARHGARTVLRNLIVVAPGGARSGVCVEPHSAPERPSTVCTQAPVLSIASAGEVRSRTITVPRGSELSLRFLDEKLLRNPGTWHHRWDWSVDVALVAPGAAIVWNDASTYIDKNGHISQYAWARPAYVVDDVRLWNSSNSDQVQVVMRVSGGDSSLRNGSMPAFTTITEAFVDGEFACLESTGGTIVWRTPHCAGDNTSALIGDVFNRNSVARDYVIQIANPATGVQIHASHAQRVDPERQGSIGLGGIPDGRWKVTMLQDGVAMWPSRLITFDHYTTCTLPQLPKIVWDPAPHCAPDGTMAIGVNLLNRKDRTAGFRIELVNMVTQQPIHGSHTYSIPGRTTQYITLGGIPAGTWYLHLLQDGEHVAGSGWAQTFVRCEQQPDCPALDRAVAQIPLTSRLYIDAEDNEFGLVEWGDNFESQSILFADGTRVIRAENEDRLALSVEPGLRMYKFLEVKGGVEFEHISRRGSLYVFDPESNAELRREAAVFFYVHAGGLTDLLEEYLTELHPGWSPLIIEQEAEFWLEFYTRQAFGEPQEYTNSSWGTNYSLTGAVDLAALAQVSPIDKYGFLPEEGRLSLSTALSDSQQVGDIVLSRSVHPSSSGEPSVVTTLTGKMSGSLSLDMFGGVSLGSNLDLTVKATIYQGLSDEPRPGDSFAVPIDRVTFELSISGDVGGEFDLSNALEHLRQYLTSKMDFTDPELLGFDQVRNVITASTSSRDGVQARVKFTVFDPGPVAQTLLNGNPAAILADFAALSASSPDSWKLTVEASEYHVDEEDFGLDLGDILRIDPNIGVFNSTSIRRDTLLGAYVITGCGTRVVPGP